MAHITTTGICVFLLVLFAACNQSSDDPTVIIDINDELNVYLWEDLRETENLFVFNVETVVNQNCQNYLLDYSLDQTARRASISINRLIAPEDCLPGAAPAHQDINLGILDPGNYEIELNLKNNEIVNTGTLLVSTDEYRIQMDSDHGIIIPQKTLQRMPKDAIWGYIGIHDMNQESDILGDFQALMDDLTEPADYPSGHYGYFDLDAQGQLTVHREDEQVFSNLYNFLYRFDDDLETLTNIVGQLRSNYDTAMEIKLYTAKGQVL
ncbi:MAG: hypothetical protein AAGD05_07945 [Bacteroidota bacterium]